MTRKTLKNKSVSQKVSSGPNKSRRKKKKQAIHDSSASCGTNVRVRVDLSGPRVHTSIRPNAKLWGWFVGYCRKISSSTCRELDDYLLGLYSYVKHVPHNALLKRHVTNVTVSPVRNIMRVRRRRVEYVNDDEVLDQRVTGSRLKCDVCGQLSYARGIAEDDSQVWLCRQHFLLKKRSFKGYRYVKDEG